MRVAAEPTADVDHPNQSIQVQALQIQHEDVEQPNEQADGGKKAWLGVFGSFMVFVNIWWAHRNMHTYTGPLTVVQGICLHFWRIPVLLRARLHPIRVALSNSLGGHDPICPTFHHRRPCWTVI